MTDSSKIIDAFNAPRPEERLHEVSGITEGVLTIDEKSVDVTVAIADKNNVGGDDKRTGVDQVGISYVGSDDKAVYQTIDVVDKDGNALPRGFGPEDIDYSSEFGVYVVVDEGGKGEAPTIYTATIEENKSGELKMVIQTSTQMNVPSADGGNTNIGFTKYGNGIEGLAIDSDGRIYMGEQDSGIVYRVNPIVVDGQISGFEQKAVDVLDTDSNDLAGLDFDKEGNLIASFGNESINRAPNSVVKFSINGDSSEQPFNSKGYVIFKGSDASDTDKNKFDAEAVMVNSEGEIVLGSDNGLKVDDYKNHRRYQDDDSKVLIVADNNDEAVNV